MKNILWFFVFCLVTAYGQGNDPHVVIGTKDSLYSKILNENRPYYVYVPRSLSPTSRTPVLYLLDGDAHFHSVTGLVNILGGGINGTNLMPEMIVVAIPNTDRTRDLTPTHDEKMDGITRSWLKTSGGGNEFLKFIQKELIPHIDATYRTSPYRMFVGHSFGGITVIQALYTMPETFQSYVSIDPSLWWDNQVLLNKGKEFFRHADLKNKSLFIAQANTLEPGDTTINKHFESIREFATFLETRNQSGIRWAYKYYEDDSHGSVPLIAEYDAFRFIFKRYDPKLSPNSSPEDLKKYYQSLSEEMKVPMLPPEGKVNTLGYTAMNKKKMDEALQYFQMNIDNYPTSWNAYDSMGELWMNKGDKKKAIVYYQKSLELNPGNGNGRDKIKEMSKK